MKLHHHTTISVVISGILFMVFKSTGMAVSCLLSGILIDLDHIIDYLREHGWPFKVKKFFYVCDKSHFSQIMLLWHGWEWLILFGAAAWLSEWNPWVTGTFIGLTQHMFIDSVFNGNSLRSYSIIWRWKQSFDFDVIFPGHKDPTYKL
jgi:hypothetical protein